MNALNRVVHDYLNAFADKDLDKLVSLLSPNVMLRDWVLCEQGIEAVRAANLHIFESCSEIKIELLHLLIVGGIAVAEVDVYIDNEKPIHVVDVYEFDDCDQIVAIRAFKG